MSASSISKTMGGGPVDRRAAMCNKCKACAGRMRKGTEVILDDVEETEAVDDDWNRCMKIRDGTTLHGQSLAANRSFMMKK